MYSKQHFIISFRHTMKATKVMNVLPKGLQSMLTDGIINGCVGAVDGSLLFIIVPLNSKCHNLPVYFLYITAQMD